MILFCSLLFGSFAHLIVVRVKADGSPRQASHGVAHQGLEQGGAVQGEGHRDIDSG